MLPREVLSIVTKHVIPLIEDDKEKVFTYWKETIDNITEDLQSIVDK